FVDGLTPALWNRLRSDPGKPLVDKCIHGEYPPGSTFKMTTALAALEAGIPPTTEVSCSGSFSLGNAVFHCWKEHGHGRVNMLQAIEQSCDVFFYEMGRRLGIDAIAQSANRLGFGRRLEVDLPGERPGLIPTTRWKKSRYGIAWQKGETISCAIGQGYVV